MIQAGDKVYIPCTILSVNPGEYCTTNVEFDIPMPPYTSKTTFNALNAAQVVKNVHNDTYKLKFMKVETPEEPKK